MTKTLEAKPEHAKQIIDLFKKVYKSHSLIKYGKKSLEDNLAKNEYHSFILQNDKEIIGHGGIRIIKDIAILDSLVVDPRYRNKGFGREIFQERLKFCENKKNLTHIACYTVMQHLGSQKLYSQAFKPIGITLNRNDAYTDEDSVFNQGSSNGELVLCKPLTEKIITFPVSYKGILEKEIKKRYLDIKILPQFMKNDKKQGTELLDDYIEVDLSNPSSTAQLKIIEKENYVCLGIYPSFTNGLFTLAFKRKGKYSINSSKLKTNNDERKRFLENILEKLLTSDPLV
ncbi:MAG: GNAT family N-acetyltransferase [Nanoarchaeota archaeon]|nr:GNAT family N-acetyltransferase [Nanoarchaeota archaeon]